METSSQIFTFSSRGVSYLKRESKHFGINVERNESHTKQTKPDFAVSA